MVTLRGLSALATALIALLASGSGAAGQCGAGGDCCVATGVPGCTDVGCCNAVCAQDPFCCDVAWDRICAGEAMKLCAVCQPQPTGACCLAGVACVNGTTDKACAAQGGTYQGDNTFCLGGGGAGGGIVCGPCGPGAGDCCVANGTPGCNDAACCATVCLVDPFCCDVEWDGVCAGQAAALCGGLCGIVPPNDLCENAIALNIGDSVAGTTMGATLDVVVNQCGTSVTAPGVWYTLVGTGNTITASTCNQANYDTKISVFCACDTLQCVAGLDDTPGCAGFTTSLTWCSEAGVTHFILVHGFSAAVGTFTLSITEGGPCQPTVLCGGQCGKGDCCQPQGTPGCNDPACCAIVCAIDPFCCDTQWDGICAGEAAQFCGICGPQSGACCLPDGTCLDDQSPRSCAAQGGSFQGNGTFCFDGKGGVTCTPQSGACCLPSGQCLGQSNPEACAGAGGVFQGFGTFCFDGKGGIICKPLVGACCFPDGSCMDDTNPKGCAAQGGVFQGFDTFCFDGKGGIICKPLSGACCLADGTCLDDESGKSCAAQGGVYQGDGTSCLGQGAGKGVVCPLPTGACCIGPDCTELTSEDCLVGGGVYQGDLTLCADVVCVVPDATPPDVTCSAATLADEEDDDDDGDDDEGDDDDGGCDDDDEGLGAGDDDEDGDAPSCGCVQQITFDAFDEGGLAEVTAVIDIGCEVIPVTSGMVLDVLCDRIPGNDDDDDGFSVDDDDDGGGGGEAPCTWSVNGKVLVIRAEQATLIVTATDLAGNAATCEANLCATCNDDDDDDDGDDEFGDG